jgi:hypothetical protein
VSIKSAELLAPAVLASLVGGVIKAWLFLIKVPA